MSRNNGHFSNNPLRWRWWICLKRHFKALRDSSQNAHTERKNSDPSHSARGNLCKCWMTWMKIEVKVVIEQRFYNRSHTVFNAVIFYWTQNIIMFQVYYTLWSHMRHNSQKQSWSKNGGANKKIYEKTNVLNRYITLRTPIEKKARAKNKKICKIFVCTEMHINVNKLIN